MRSGRGFRMILHGEDRPLPVSQAFAGPVVEVQVTGLPARGRERGGIDREPVVLGGDLHAAGDEILHRVIGAVMAEGQLVGPPAGSPTPSFQLTDDAAVTSLTRSRPIRPGSSRARWRRRSTSVSVDAMMPSCAPWSRRWRVSARVSMPWMPTIS